MVTESVTPGTIAIRPRRLMAVYAVLGIVMVILSYLVLLAMAGGFLFLAYWVMTVGTGSAQLLLVALFGVVIAGALLWSLVPRRDKFEAPGPKLERAEQPRLFAQLDQIAGALNEPMPKEVYLIPDMNAWVADRGGVLGFGSRRIMGLGLPLLSLLSVEEFRAVLAHEFAHYYGGDTRLGPWVYKTRSAIIRVFENVGSLRALARINVLAAVHSLVTALLKWYFLLFMRITNLISRQQEFRADELACLVAGPQPLIEGLRTINGADAAWPAYWNEEVAPLLDGGALPRIAEGFAQFVQVPYISSQITAIVEKKIAEEKTNPFDTHPPLRERIEASNKLPALTENPGRKPGDEIGTPANAESARTLLENPEALERGFVSKFFPRVAAGGLKTVEWDRVVPEVTIPRWRASMAKYGDHLRDLTVGRLPESLTRLERIGDALPDPKGMLLSREQRKGFAVSVLGMAVGLAMIDSGWELHSTPGVLLIKKETHELNPFLVTRELAAGKILPQDWMAHCAGLGIAEYAIGGAPSGTSLANEKSAPA